MRLTLFRYSVVFLFAFILMTHAVNLIAKEESMHGMETIPIDPQFSEDTKAPSPSPKEVVTMTGMFSVIHGDPTLEARRKDPSVQMTFNVAFVPFPFIYTPLDSNSKILFPKSWQVEYDDVDLTPFGGIMGLGNQPNLIKITCEFLNEKMIRVLSIELTSIPRPNLNQK